MSDDREKYLVRMEGCHGDTYAVAWLTPSQEVGVRVVRRAVDEAARNVCTPRLQIQAWDQAPSWQRARVTS